MEVIKYNNQNQGILQVIDKALSSPDFDPNKLVQLFELRERWEASESMKAYHKAMAAFKANPPHITKDKHVKYNTSKGTTDYKHASLYNISSTINTELSKHGLTAGWETKQDAKQISVTCRITHEMGHSESTSLSAFSDESGGKNAIQAIGSTVTYLERYTLLALTGLSTQDQDDDGNGSGAPVEFITPNQLADIIALFQEVDGNEEAFCKYFKILKIEELPAKFYEKAVAMLEAKRGK